MAKFRDRGTGRARALRNAATPAERQLWRYLRNQQLGARFNRQLKVGAFFPDFLCRDAMADGRLQPALTTSKTTEGVFRALWPASRHMLPRLRVFVDFLGERLSEPAPFASTPAI